MEMCCTFLFKFPFPLDHEVDIPSFHSAHCTCFMTLKRWLWCKTIMFCLFFLMATGDRMWLEDGIRSLVLKARSGWGGELETVGPTRMDVCTVPIRKVCHLGKNCANNLESEKYAYLDMCVHLFSSVCGYGQDMFPLVFRDPWGHGVRHFSFVFFLAVGPWELHLSMVSPRCGPSNWARHLSIIHISCPGSNAEENPLTSPRTNRQVPEVAYFSFPSWQNSFRDGILSG
jgi:hypothetical protein